MSPDHLDAAIDELEDALSDLRWANRGGKRGFYIAKARAAMDRAEDHLDKDVSQLLETERRP